jgi:HAD superfamily hydrolase (TIGR01509 family)
VKAIIFDMDGVIVNSEPRHERAFLDVVEEIGFGGRHGLRFADYIGRSDTELWVDFVAKNRPNQSLQELLKRKRDRVIEIIRRERPLFPGVSALVRQVSKHYKLALASGSERPVVEEVLKLDGLAKHFPVVVTGSDVTRGKPAPDIFLKAAHLLEVPPSTTWVIEDSKPGVAAGLAAGMQVIAITNTHPAEQMKNAAFVVSSYEEIARLLNEN